MGVTGYEATLSYNNLYNIHAEIENDFSDFSKWIRAEQQYLNTDLEYNLLRKNFRM